jgi:hypothetical protein
MRTRAALLAPVHNTQSPDNLPEMGKNIASKANRDGIAARFPAPAVPKSLEVALALIGDDDPLLTDLELPIVQTAKQHDAPTLYRLQSVPGMGKLLSLVLLDEMQDSQRFPRGQDVVSSCRWVTWAKESTGKRYGTSGAKIGNASLTWAFSEAAVLCLRNPPAGQQYLARLEKKHGTGKAFALLAQQLARAVYSMLRRDTVFAMDQLLHSEGNGTGEPVASLGHSGMHLVPVLCTHEPTASPNAHEPIGS